MSYAVLMVALFVIPITAGAIAGARLSQGECWLILFGILVAMVVVPLTLFQFLPKGLIPWLEDMAAWLVLIVLLLHGAIIGEFWVGVRLGQERRRAAEIEAGAPSAEIEKGHP